MLRLQIDNCLRFYAVYLVSDPHQFANDVLNGGRIAKMKDQTGSLLTDSYLTSRLSEDHPWIKRVYEKTSGYIHLSDIHIFNIFAPTENSQRAENIQSLCIGPGDNFPDDTLYEEAVDAFIEATKVLFKYLVGWQKTKEHPLGKKEET